GSDAIATLAAFLHANGAPPNPSKRAANHKALVTYFRSPTLATRAGAPSALYRAPGPPSIPHGPRWAARPLQHRVLADNRITIYKAGRGDIKRGRVDARVLMAMEYLANAVGPIKVSELVSGHQLFTSSGTVSAHVYGRAVNIAAVDGI